jgi:DNA-binding NarL/FixJ family response regulator
LINILLVDDHASFRQPLAFLLEQEPGLAVVAQAESITEASRLLSKQNVDVALVDLDLPDGNGADLVENVLAANPGGATLILTGSRNLDDHARAIAAGASKVLHKSATIDEVIWTVRLLGGDAGI